MAGIGSRRKNDELILTGVVSVNGRTVKELGFQVKPASDRVTINGKPVALAQKNVYILLNKPRDCITTLSDEKGRTTVIDYVRVRQRVYPVGRLDRNSTGVLILTNDGAFANRLTHPKYEIDKEYRVSLDKKISTEHLGLLRHKGVRLADGLARPKSVEVVKTSGRQQVVISIHEGKNREIRRMCEALGYVVKQLDRISFGGIAHVGVARGKWRFLNNSEVRHLRGLSEGKKKIG